jgi:hypothetical protein
MGTQKLHRKEHRYCRRKFRARGYRVRELLCRGIRAPADKSRAWKEGMFRLRNLRSVNDPEHQRLSSPKIYQITMHRLQLQLLLHDSKKSNR